MDRNASHVVFYSFVMESPPARVAWIETRQALADVLVKVLSPPARVAWIETSSAGTCNETRPVATREGGVDRNTLYRIESDTRLPSPPARVAWIETG